MGFDFYFIPSSEFNAYFFPKTSDSMLFKYILSNHERILMENLKVNGDV